MQEDIAGIGAAPRAARQIRNILCGAENVGRFPGHAIGQNVSVP